MATASLPELPRGREFEELIAAAFQGAGYFVERDIIERDKIEILQLDALCTDYAKRPPLLHLIEAKSGEDWGFKDIFKIRGWKGYLKLTRAALVTATKKDRFEHYQRLADKVGVNLILVENPKNLEGLIPYLGDISINSVDVSSWRFAYWVERELIDRVRSLGRSHQDKLRFKSIIDHAFEVKSGVFFTETIADRVEALYNTYQQYHNLAGRCGVEIGGGDFNTVDARIPESVFSKAFHEHELDEIHAACWMEHQARLSLLKAAVDYISYKEDGEESKAERTITWVIDDQTFTMSAANFPFSFERALTKIEGEPAFRRYPVFWQWFLGVLGGFILKDYEEQDLTLLSQKSGVPIDQVQNALDVFDKLFPIGGGWFRETSNSNIRFIMLYPHQMHGIGANYRRLMYTENGKFESLALTGQYTRSDLLQWNNATVKLLT